MTTFAEANARLGNLPYWWVAIEGIQNRWGLLKAGADPVFDAWNPAVGGTNQHIYPRMARFPSDGGQQVDPLNGKCSIRQFKFSLSDISEEITQLLAVSNTPFASSFLTAEITAADAIIPVADHTDFPSSGNFFLDRETINYTSKGSTSTARTSDKLLAQAASHNGTVYHLRDNTHTEAEDYWVDGWIKFTNGANNGLWRKVTRWVYNDPFIGEQHESYYWEDPVNAATAIGDTYELHYSPRRIYDPGLAGAWKGSVLVVTADTDWPENVGQVRWVKDYAGGVFELYEPLPRASLGNTSFTLVRKWFIGCSRGMYDSTAAVHKVTDDHNQTVVIPISVKPPFIKKRKVWLYENRVGCAEAEAKCIAGEIMDYSQDSSYQSFTFDCRGILSELSKKIMQQPYRGNVACLDVWGGHYNLLKLQGLSQSMKVPWPSMSDGRRSDFAVTEVLCGSPARPNFARMNIKIGSEIMHVKPDPNTIWFRAPETLGQKVQMVFWLRLAEEFVDVSNITGEQLTTMIDGNAAMMIPTEPRGLFANKIGLPAIQNQYTNADEYRPEFFMSDPEPAVSAFMEEHTIGDEIVHVCLCDDSPRSDFPKYDKVYYTGKIGTPSARQTLTGVRSGTTATVMADYAAESYVLVTGADGDFDDLTGETVGTPTFNGTVTEHRKEIRPRNNIIDVMLQLMMSSGTPGATGIYDTLPEGWGLGFTSSLVNLSSFEQLRDKIFSSTRANFILHEPTSFKEWAEENVCKFLQVFFYQDNDGKIAINYLYTESEARDADEASALVAIDSSKQEAEPLPGWSAGQEPVTKVLCDYNKHPVDDEWFSEMTINFGLAWRYFEGFGRTVRVKCGILYTPELNVIRVNPRDPHIPELVGRLINPMWARHSLFPVPRIRLRSPYWARILVPGQLVKFTQANIPNLRTGTRGMTGEYFQVMGIDPNEMDGFMDVILWQVGVHDAKFAPKCPSGAVYSYAADTPVAGKSTVVLYDAVYSQSWQKKDVEFFVVADEVMFMDQDTYVPKAGAVPDIETIESIAGDNIVFGNNLANPPVQWDIMEVAPYDSATSTRKSTRVFMGDDEGLLGAADDNAFKYM
jgi:hypothetical protein